MDELEEDAEEPAEKRRDDNQATPEKKREAAYGMLDQPTVAPLPQDSSRNIAD